MLRKSLWAATLYFCLIVSVWSTPTFGEDDDEKKSKKKPTVLLTEYENTIGLQQRWNVPPPSQVARSDRWRVLYDLGIKPSFIDPFNQNPIKGDFPLFGNSGFALFTANYVPTAKFNNQDGQDTQINNAAVVALELFGGTANVFEPKRWRLKASGKGIFNRGNDNQDVEDFALEEAFGEVRLFEVGDNFDFTSARAGIQVFKSDFNSLIFQDLNPGGQLFGELSQNRYQWTTAYVRRLIKENGLVTFNSQDQDVIFANLFIEDFLRPGFNTVFSGHYFRDRFNGRELDVFYAGVASAGHWGRIVFSPAFYFAFGTEELGGGSSLDIAAFLAGFEFEYPSNFLTYRAAAFIASGDSDPNDDKSNAFASINENINLFGGPNSFVIGGGAFTVGNSFIPARNFNHEGMTIFNAGLDFVFTPKLFFATNFNYFQFLEAESNSVGFEVNGAINHRLFLNENFIIQIGANAFFPQSGVEQLVGEDVIITVNTAIVTLF